MKTNRRRFLATALAGGAAAALPLSSPAAAARSTGNSNRVILVPAGAELDKPNPAFTGPF